MSTEQTNTNMSTEQTNTNMSTEQTLTDRTTEQTLTDRTTEQTLTDRTEEILYELGNIYEMCDCKDFYESKKLRELLEKINLFSHKYFDISFQGNFSQDCVKDRILHYITVYLKKKKIETCKDTMIHLSVCTECFEALNDNYITTSTLCSCKEVMLHLKECYECYNI